jgi:spore maturation protein CgeB
MNYRFLKITTVYESFLRTIYTNNINLKSLNYNLQYQFIMNQFFGWSDSYEYYLEKLGYETSQIITNAQTLQNTWAKENDIKNGSNILVEQIKKIDPEILFIQDPNSIDYKVLSYLKKELKNLKLIIAYRCAPSNEDAYKLFDFCDIILTCTEGFKKHFEEKNLKCEILSHAFDVRILDKINPNKNNDIIFVGSIIVKEGFHNERKKFIEYLQESNISIRVYSEQFNNACYGLDYFNLLSSSYININNHIDIAGSSAGNMRLFETTGVGTCLLTDYKENISNFFDIDSEIVCYKNFEEAVEKIIWLNNHPKAVAGIAKKGQLKTLEKYSYSVKTEELNQIINKYLK